MELFSDVYERIKRKNKILFVSESLCIAPLCARISALPRRAVVMFAFECAKKPAEELKAHVGESDALQTIDLCRAWAEGKVKMPLARRAILNLHARAKSMDEADGARYRAIAQAYSAVHVKEHARGLMYYELTAIVRENKNFEEKVLMRIEEYSAVLDRWASCDLSDYSWAKFLQNR